MILHPCGLFVVSNISICTLLSFFHSFHLSLLSSFLEPTTALSSSLSPLLSLPLYGSFHPSNWKREEAQHLILYLFFKENKISHKMHFAPASFLFGPSTTYLFFFPFQHRSSAAGAERERQRPSSRGNLRRNWDLHSCKVTFPLS